MNGIAIGNRSIGSGHPCFLIAEAGVNHNGHLEMAHKLVDAAAAAGADAVKFQTFSASKVISRAAPKAGYQKETTNPSESQLEMVRKLELSPEAHHDLALHCRDLGLIFLSTPFDEASVDLLDELGVLAFKVGSGEITNWPFLDYIARKGKPILLSTGMSYLGEVDAAVRVIRQAGDERLVLLHCVSNYPASPSDVNLGAMQTMASTFRVPVGYSDHTPGNEVAIAAVALGARVIEKHFTLDRSLPGPDHRASLEPKELAELVSSVRIVEAALGDGQKRPAASEADTAAAARRSLVAAQDIDAGIVVTAEMIALKRPGTGLPPAMQPCIVGRTTRTAIEADTLLAWEMFV